MHPGQKRFIGSWSIKIAIFQRRNMTTMKNMEQYYFIITNQ